METDDGHTYKFTAANRGRAVIIVNKNFDKRSQLKDRDGADQELMKMREFFQILGFEIKESENLTANEMKNILKEAAEYENKRGKHDADCFALVICSHGAQEDPQTDTGSQIVHKPHFIYGVDGGHVLTEDIVGYFSDSNCKALRDKPKLFFFQACRAQERSKLEDRFDAGIPIHVVTEEDHVQSKGVKRGYQTDSKETECSEVTSDPDTDSKVGNTESIEESQRTTGVVEEADKDNVSNSADGPGNVSKIWFEVKSSRVTSDDIVELAEISCHTDMLIMFPSPEGKFAFRRADDGGWLVQSLYECSFIDGFEKMDLLTFLTTVTCNTVQNKEFRPGGSLIQYYGSKIAPFITHRLRKSIYFNDSKLKPRVVIRR